MLSFLWLFTKPGSILRSDWMAFDEKLAARIKKTLGKTKNISEKHMFGGLSFMYGKKMFCGVLKDDLVLKMGPKQCEDALKKPNVRPMDFTGKPMKGFVYVNQKGCKSDKDLKKWVDISLNHAKLMNKKSS
jgi:TfoX/Sxy family transcriptional regulator of competence genes